MQLSSREKADKDDEQENKNMERTCGLFTDY